MSKLKQIETYVESFTEQLADLKSRSNIEFSNDEKQNELHFVTWNQNIHTSGQKSSRTLDIDRKRFVLRKPGSHQKYPTVSSKEFT